MKYSHILSIAHLSAFFTVANAQQALPYFEEPVKQEMLSSDAEESFPLTYLNGKNIYFVRTYIEGSMKERVKGQEIWSSSNNNGTWSEPVSLFYEANDNGNNAVIGTSKDGNRVYVFNSIQTRRKLAKGIAFTEKGEDGKWSSLTKLEVPGFIIGNGLYSFFVNPDEDIMLIGMSVQDSTNSDLFVSTKRTDGTWGTLQSLGSTINSKGNELSPFLSSNKRVLYFASNGHGGLGGTDIFVSIRKGDDWNDWTTPVNLGTPINSPDFDAYFVLDATNNEAYFTSNRGQKYSDIYSSKIIKKSTLKNKLLGQFNYQGLPAENVTLKIYDQNGNFIQEVVTDQYGQFNYEKLDPEQSYLIKLSEEDVMDFPDAKIYLLDDAGTKIKRLNFLSLGNYSESGNIKLIQGQVTSAKKITAPVTLNLYDQGGNFIKQVITDDGGNFNYTQLATDEVYIIKVKEEDESKLMEPEILLLNPISKKMTSFNQVKDLGSFSDHSQKANPIKKELKGIYTVKGVPLANAHLVVYDESGFIVDTLHTDANGEFVYNKLTLDNTFTIKALNATDEELKDSELVFLGENNKKEVKEISANQFVYNENNTSVPNSKLSIKNEPVKKHVELVESKPPSKKVESPTTTTPVVKEKATTPTWNNDSAVQILQFDFNSYFLDKEDWSKLHKVATILRHNPKATAELIGHTDTSGTEKVNYDISIQRAEQAKNYLSKIGIDVSRIMIKGMKDNQPVASNATREGRIKNRRVEIYIRP